MNVDGFKETHGKVTVSLLSERTTNQQQQYWVRTNCGVHQMALTLRVLNDEELKEKGKRKNFVLAFVRELPQLEV